MTKEELKKEAEEKADIYFNSLEVDNGNVSDTRFSDYDVFVAYEKGALDFAEPREKRIAELETRCAELFLQNNEFAEQLTKAKDIIEKLISDNRKVWIYSDVREQAEQFLKDSEGK